MGNFPSASGASLGNQKFQVDLIAKLDASTKHNFEQFKKLQDAINTSQQQMFVQFMQSRQQANALNNSFTNLNKTQNNLGGGFTRLTSSIIPSIAVGNVLGKVFGSILDKVEDIIEKVPAMGQELYYMSRRLGTSTSGLFSYAFGAQMIGLSREQGLGQLESMGSVLRNQPGMQAFLSTIIPGYKGGDSLNPENQLQLVNTLKGQMGESGYYVASQFAQSFGMNENVFRQMWTNVDELNAAYEDHQKLLKELGLNTEKSSKDFVGFDRELTKSKTILTDVFTSIESWAAEHIGTPTLAAVNEASRAAIRAPGNKPGSNVGSPVSEFGASLLESIFGF